MSRIDKLSILGVRSFDNKKPEVIQFHTPLTLIVGLNGSGKTTIIECLKYATTGELPANSKTGGAFIHDPKLCGEKEVLAQVKISFKSTNGARMVCTRSLQLTVKKNARTQKTLEGSLNIQKDGDKQTLSTRVAEMDVRYKPGQTKIFFHTDADRDYLNQSLMPEYLGVSKAILDNVIFCHQEESLWPLSEAGKLKTRFDEIFEALKYTKAIENLKVIAKQQREKLAVYKKDEEHTKVIKGKAEQNQKRTTELWETIESLRVKSDDIGVKIKEAARNSEEAWRQANEAHKIVGELTGKRIQAQTKDDSVRNLKRNLTEMNDTDEDLQQMLEQYEERVQTYEDELAVHTGRYQNIVKDITTARSNVGTKERECGSYEAQKVHYDEQVESREKLVKETARSHNIRGFDMEVDDTQVQAFIERISKMARDQNATFERARRETQDELQGAQKVLNQINEQKSALNQRKESARQTITSNDRKIGSLQNDLNNINVDEGGKIAMESDLRDTEAKLESAKSDIGSSNWDSSIESAEAELRQFDDHKEKLEAELVEGTKQAGDSARLDFVQKEMKDRQQSVETMTGAHGDKISSFVGREWTPANLETDYQRMLQQSQSYIEEAEKQRDGTVREKEQLDYKLNSAQSDLKTKRAAFKAAEKAIHDAVDCAPEDYSTELQRLEESRDILKSDSEAYANVIDYFNSCIKTAKEQKGCRTCARQFKNDQDLEKMLQTVEKEKKRYEGDNTLSSDLKDAEAGLKEARDVSPEYDTWKKLKDQIPVFERDEVQLDEKRKKLISQLEDQDTVVKDRYSAKRDIEAINKTIQNIAKYSSEITNFEKQITELKAKQEAAGMSRGLEAIQQDIKKVNDGTRSVKASLTKSTNDRDRSRKLINTLELERSNIKSKLSTAEYQLKEKKSLDTQVQELKQLNNEQRNSVKSIDQELQDRVPQLSQAQAKYDEIARRGAEKDRDLQAESNKLNNSLSDLKKADQDVKSYIEKGGPQQLARGKREAEMLKDEVRRLEKEQSDTVRTVKKLEDQLRNHSETKRSIEDNQQYRSDLRELQAVRTEIEELETHNAEADEDRYQSEGHKWQMDRNRYAGEQATIIGQMKSHDHQMEQLLQDYETDYKDAPKKHKEAHIMVETTKACVEDLGRYGGALDQAVMKYHSLKMDEINNIIAELWRNTYQGTDVDTIMIRSESETGKGNKNYNYRVVMVKQDAEMDMRGRCSAGQKVLASIIIRLALAECFGVNCGIIALDEPTTNLDRDNIQALAESLNNIIKMRRQQRNFQLIVITHDEDFLRYMKCSDFADVYWRVSRNASQKSQIERQNISEVL